MGLYSKTVEKFKLVPKTGHLKALPVQVCTSGFHEVLDIF